MCVGSSVADEWTVSDPADRFWAVCMQCQSSVARCWLLVHSLAVAAAGMPRLGTRARYHRTACRSDLQGLAYVPGVWCMPVLWAMR